MTYNFQIMRKLMAAKNVVLGTIPLGIPKMVCLHSPLVILENGFTAGDEHGTIPSLFKSFVNTDKKKKETYQTLGLTFGRHCLRKFKP